VEGSTVKPEKEERKDKAGGEEKVEKKELNKAK